MRHALIVLHVLLAVAVLASMSRQLGQRQHAVDAVRRQTEADTKEAMGMRAELELGRNLLDGVRTRDPYVVELLARERLGYRRPGELVPPPMIDSGETHPIP